MNWLNFKGKKTARKNSMGALNSSICQTPSVSDYGDVIGVVKVEQDRTFSAQDFQSSYFSCQEAFKVKPSLGDCQGSLKREEGEEVKPSTRTKPQLVKLEVGEDAASKERRYCNSQVKIEKEKNADQQYPPELLCLVKVEEDEVSLDCQHSNLCMQTEAVESIVVPLDLAQRTDNWATTQTKILKSQPKRWTVQTQERNTEDEGLLYVKLEQRATLPEESYMSCLCAVCGETFIKLSEFIEDTRGIPHNLSYCEKCENLMFHTSQKLYQCAKCDKSFDQKSHLYRHHRIHTGERPYYCTECKKYFTDTSTLRRHWRIHTGEKPYKCTVCDKSFTEGTELRGHQRIHTGEKPYKCKVCEKSFSLRSSLRNHQKIHAGEKPHKCVECEKSFVSRSSVSRHLMTHTGEKPFKCTECERSFARRSHLSRHQMIHTGEKPFKCAECERRFSRGSHLQRHQTIHTGERPHKCTDCSRHFREASELKKHQLSHTGKNPYQCNQCNKSFNGRARLEEHQMIHLGGMPTPLFTV